MLSDVHRSASSDDRVVVADVSKLTMYVKPGDLKNLDLRRKGVFVYY